MNPLQGLRSCGQAETATIESIRVRSTSVSPGLPVGISFPNVRSSWIGAFWKKLIGIIDFHTGLGPWGLGERIVTHLPSSDGFARASRWYGSGVVCPDAGTSSSAPIVGDGLSASVGLLPHARVTGMALEFGTIPILEVLDALRADAWLHAHGNLDSSEGRAIKAQIRAAFYGDAPDWKGMIVGQALLACRQAVIGLSA